MEYLNVNNSQQVHMIILVVKPVIPNRGAAAH